MLGIKKSFTRTFFIGVFISVVGIETAQAKDTLLQGEQLGRDEQLLSNNGCFRLIMQGDGNLVLYGNTMKPMWNAASNGPADKAIMQNDGNFVVYKPNMEPVWAAHPPDRQGLTNFRLIVQDDGNTVIYANNGSQVKPIWFTGTPERNCDGSVITSLNMLPQETSGTVKGPNNRKSMGGGFAEAETTFFRNGLAVIETHSVSTSFTQGTKGSVFIVGSDIKGRALFVSPVFDIPTACSRPDSCSSNRRDTIQHQINSELAKFVAKIDVFVQDRGITDLRESFKRTITETCGTFDDLPSAAKAAIAAESGFSGCGPK